MEHAIKSLIGKRVIVFDVETTGLPVMKEGWFDNPADKYYDFRDNTKYDGSRIVEIAWSYIENFHPSDIDVDDIESFIRKPVDFHDIQNTHIHNISYSRAMKNGELLGNILNDKGLAYAIRNCDYVIAHNAAFDINILLNELYRLKFNTTLAALEKLLNTSRMVCTCKLGMNVCKIENKRGTYKFPTLDELYRHYHHRNPDIQHSAYYDVKSLLEILKKINK